MHHIVQYKWLGRWLSVLLDLRLQDTMCLSWSQEEGTTSQLKTMSERIARLAAVVGWSSYERLDHFPQDRKWNWVESIYVDRFILIASQNPFFPKLYLKLLLFVKNNNN